jgi:hypothetical protein
MFYIPLHPLGISAQLDLVNGLNLLELNPSIVYRKWLRHIVLDVRHLQQCVRFQVDAMTVQPLEPQEHLSIFQVKRIVYQLHALQP